MSAGQMATEARAAALVDLDITDSGFIQATAVPYNTKTDIGWFTESFKPGAFKKSIGEAARSLPLHVFHDDAAQPGMDSWPIGVATEWIDDGDRLRGVWKFDDSDKAQRARALATPDVDGNAMLGYMSVRFQPIRDAWDFVPMEQWDPDNGVKDHVDRVEARLVSVALVSTPAYIGATVDWVRSAGAPGRDTGRRAVDEWAAYLEKVKAGPLG